MTKSSEDELRSERVKAPAAAVVDVLVEVVGGVGDHLL